MELNGGFLLRADAVLQNRGRVYYPMPSPINWKSILNPWRWAPRPHVRVVCVNNHGEAILLVGCRGRNFLVEFKSICERSLDEAGYGDRALRDGPGGFLSGTRTKDGAVGCAQ